VQSVEKNVCVAGLNVVVPSCLNVQRLGRDLAETVQLPAVCHGDDFVHFAMDDEDWRIDLSNLQSFSVRLREGNEKAHRAPFFG